MVNSFEHTYWIILIAAIVASIDATVLAFLFGNFTDKIVAKEIVNIPGRFALSHLLLCLFGWLISAQSQSLVYNTWVLISLFLFLLLMGVIAVFQYHPGTVSRKKYQPNISQAKLNLIALAAGVDSIIVGMLATVIGFSGIRASIITGATVLALTSAAYVSSRAFYKYKNVTAKLSRMLEPFSIFAKR